MDCSWPEPFLNTLNDLSPLMSIRHSLLLLLPFLISWVNDSLFGQESAAGGLESSQPSAQEVLLAELLANVPEESRAAMIARALATVRVEAVGSASSTSELGEPARNRLSVEMESLKAAQKRLLGELQSLRLETRLLRAQVQHTPPAPQRELVQTPLLPAPPIQSQAFRLPNFQRPTIQFLPGPYVNQPSPSVPVWGPMQPSSPEAAAELAQLQRDLQQLNERLKQWQEPGAAPVADQPREASEPALLPQANRPSPLLPR